MKDQRKSKAQLVDELSELRQRIAQLQASEGEHKRAAEAVRVQRDKFESVVASLSDGLDIVTRDYRVEYQTKVLRDRFGDLTGELCYEGYMSRQTPCDWCPMAEALASGSRQRAEMTGADGREYEVASTPFQDIDGETKVIEIVRDITERKRAEEEIRRRNEELEALNAIGERLGQSLDLTVILDRALGQVLEIMGTEAGGIYLADETTGRLTLTAHRGVSDEFVDQVGVLHVDEVTVERVTQLGRRGKLVLLSELLLKDRTLLKSITAAIAQEKLRSYHQVLIRSKGSPAGLLVVASRESRKFTAQQEKLLSTIADQMGMAIENAGLYQEQLQRVFQMEALRKTALEITQQLDLDVLLESIVSRAVRLLDGGAGGLYLYQREQDLLEWAVAAGDGLAPIGTTLERGEGLSGKVWEAGEPLIVDDYGHWEGRAPTYEGYALHAVVGVPVRWGEKFLGVLNVLTESPRFFSSADAELLSLFAHQAAVAIENARLYEEVQRELAERKRAEEEVRHRVRELELLQDAGTTIVSTLDLKNRLQLIVDSAVNSVPSARTGSVHLLHEERRELHMMAGHGFGREVMGEAIFKVGEGFSGWVVAHDQPLITGNVTADPRFKLLDVSEALGQGSAVCVPLRVEDRVLGTISLGNEESYGAFDENDLRLLSAFANQAAIAIENARLYEDTRHRAQELAALYDVSLEMSAQLGLAPLLDTVVQRAIDLLGGFSGGLYLFDAEREELELTAARWPGGDPTGVRLAVGEGVCGRVAQTGKPLVVTDYANWEGRPAKFDSGTTFSVLGVPVKLGDTLLGALYVNDTDVERGFDEGDVRLAALFANQAAVAIENARLYEETGRRVDELAALYDISLEVVARTDLLELLPSMVREAAQLLAADSGGVYLFDLETQELELRVSYGYKKDRTGLRLGLGEGLAGKIAQSQEPWMVNDYSQWDGRSPQWEEEALVASMGVPLKRGDDLLGVLFLDRSVRGPFNDDDLKLATLFANQAAIAIENAQLLGEITEHEKDLQKLSSQLIRAQEEERKRISHELHDQMGQALTAMSINLAAIEQELGTDLDPMTRDRLAETDSLIDEALDQVRDLSLELRPSMLDDLGLLSALRWYVDRYTTRAHVEVEFEAVALEERLHPDLETVLYRVVQESLTNVARHAQAGRVQVRLERKESAVTALIEDDGVGFNVEEVRGREVDERGAGLLGISERVSAVQGSLNVESAPGEGTRLTIEIPLK